MKVAKLRNVKTPHRGTEKSAGIDFFVPEFDDKFIEDFHEKNGHLFQHEEMETYKHFSLLPGERVLIPSGVKVNFEGEPKGLMGVNKSGIASKLGLTLMAKLIDQDFQGELLINLLNTSDTPVFIKENMKIAQFVLIPVYYDDIEEVDINELYKSKNQRGEGGFGSTGE